jgi:hypothetical protein
MTIREYFVGLPSKRFIVVVALLMCTMFAVETVFQGEIQQFFGLK